MLDAEGQGQRGGHGVYHKTVSQESTVSALVHYFIFASKLLGYNEKSIVCWVNVCAFTLSNMHVENDAFGVLWDL